MPADLIAAPSVGDVGDTWAGWVIVVTDDGAGRAPDSVTAAFTLPGGSSAACTVTAQTAVGLYKVEYDLAQTGWHQLAVTVTDATYGDEVLTATVLVSAVTGALPTVAAVTSYLGETSATAEEILDAYDAEVAAQARVCDIPADYPADLGQALKRRVARNLAARAVPVASFTSFEGGGTSTRVPKIDAEVARFEGPFRRWVVA